MADLMKLQLELGIDGDSSVVSGLEKVKSAAGKTGRSVGRMAAMGQKAGDGLGRMAAMADGLTVPLGRVRTEVLGLAAGYASLAGVRSLGRIADDYAMLEAKISLGTGSQAEFNEVYERLYDLGRETGGSLAANAQAFNRLALSGDYALHDILISQETLNRAMIVAGATTEENASAIP